MPFIPERINNNKLLIAIGIIILIGAIAYFNVLRNGFLIDDNNSIIKNEVIKDILHPSRIFTSYYIGKYYRPLVLLSLSLDYSIWKLNPFGYHLTNIILHIINSVLFFLLFCLILKRPEVSFIASLLFCIHPINNVTVAYISDRGNLLVSLFMLGALFFVYYGYKKRSLLFNLAGFLMFVLALLSRENAVLFPLYLGCVFMISTAGEDIKYSRKVIILGSLISVLYLLFRQKDMGLLNYFYKNSSNLFELKNLTAYFCMVWNYIALSIFPKNICFFNRIEPVLALPAILIFVMLAIMCFLCFKYRKNKIVLFSCTWFLVGILPLYKLMFSRLAIGRVMQTSWIYFSSIGLFIAVGLFLTSLKRILGKKIYIIVLGCIFLFYLHSTLFYNTLWANTQTYCLYWLKHVPGNPVAIINLAEYYFKNNDYENALKYYKLYITEIDYRYISGSDKLAVLSSVGIIYYEQGNFDAACENFYAALALDSDRPKDDLHLNLGHIYYLKNNFGKAAYHYNQAIEENFFNAKAHNNLSILYKLIGKNERALHEKSVYRQIKKGRLKKNDGGPLR